MDKKEDSVVSELETNRTEPGPGIHPEILEAKARKWNIISGAIWFLLFGIIAFAFAGYPIFGQPLYTWTVISALVAALLLVTFLTQRDLDVKSTIRSLPPYEYDAAVKSVMDVRVAVEEDGIESYSGYLLLPSQDAFARIDGHPSGRLAILQDDDKLPARITLIPARKRADLAKRPVRPFTHILLFVLTLVTTTIAGAAHQDINLLETPERFTAGLPFSLSILLILGLHELGHYMVARFNRIKATPPYFIPAPPPLGTFGAFISMRSLSPNRKAMFDTAAAGPLLGAFVATFFLAIGLTTSAPGNPLFSSMLLSPEIGSSFLFTALAQFANPEFSYGMPLRLNAFAFAGWLGLLITAINLIPIGQLDGGHIAQGLLGRKGGTVVSALSTLTLFMLALFVWPELLLFAILVIFLAGGSDVAKDSLTPAGPARFFVGAFAYLLMLAILLPVPLPLYQLFF